MRRRSMRAVAGALTAIVVGAACIEAQAPPPVAGGSPQVAVSRMLERRADAAGAGDRDAFLRPVGGQALRLESNIADALGRLPVAGADIRIREMNVPRGGGRVRDVRIDFAYWLEDLADDNLLHLPLLYDLVQRDGSWVIVRSDIDVDELDDSPVPMWFTGPFEMQRSDHFVALFRPGLDNPGDVLEDAETAWSRLVREVTFPVDDKNLMVIARDADELEEFSGQEEAIAAAGWAFYQAAGRMQVRPENRHIVVDRAALVGLEAAIAESEEGSLARLTPTQVFKHELGHLALSRVTSEYTPGWVVEGGAMFMAGEERVNEWAAGLALAEFDDLSFVELGRRRGLPGEFGYAYANAATEYLVEERGPRTYWEFYRGFHDFVISEPRSEQAIRSDRARRLLNLLYGMTERDLDRAARTWMEGAVAGTAP